MASRGAAGGSGGASALSAADAAAGVLKKGLLLKQGALVRSWKERWFVLKGGVLTYSKTVGSPALGEIQIKSIVDVGATDATDTTVREFSIVTDERNYHFRCHTHEDCMVCLRLCTYVPLCSAASGMGGIAAQGAGRCDGCHGHRQRRDHVNALLTPAPSRLALDVCCLCGYLQTKQRPSHCVVEREPLQMVGLALRLLDEPKHLQVRDSLRKPRLDRIRGRACTSKHSGEGLLRHE